MLKKIILFLIAADLFFVSVFNSAFDEAHAYIFIIGAFLVLFLFLFLKKESIKVDLPFIILILILPIFVVFSSYRYISLLNVYVILSAAVFYFVLLNILNKDSELFLERIVVLIGVFVAFVGYLAYLTAGCCPHSVLSQYFINHSFLAGTRVCSFFQYPNSFAGFLLVPLFISIHLARQSNRWYKVMLYIISGFLLFSVYLSASRGALIVLVLCIALLYIFFDKTLYKSITLSIAVVLGVAMLFIFINGKLFLPVVAENSKRIKTLVGFFAGEQNRSLYDRIQLARDAVNIFLHHPIFGTGLGTFKDAMLKYRVNLFFAREPHSMPFRILAETGIVGFFTFFYFFVAGFLKGFKRNSFVYIGVVALLLHTFLDLDFAYPVIVSLIFIGLAIIMYQSKMKNFRFNMHLRYAVGILIIFFLVVSLVPNFLASLFYRRGMSSLENTNYTSALNNFNVAVRLNPQNAEFHEAIGNCFKEIGYSDPSHCTHYINNAIGEYLTAANCNKLSFIYPLYAGKLDLLLKDSESIALLKKSLSLNPLWKPILSDIALSVAYTTNQQDEAVKYATEALKFSAEKSDYEALRYTNSAEKNSTAYTALGFAKKETSYFDRAISIKPNGFAYLGRALLAENLTEKVENLRFSMDINPCIAETRALYFANAPLIKVISANTDNNTVFLTIAIPKNRQILNKILVDAVCNNRRIYIKSIPASQSKVSFLLPKDVRGKYRIELVGVDKNGITVSKTISPLFSKNQ